MKAVVFHAIGDIRVEDVPEPVIEQPTDAIVRLTASAICGTDLHFVRGTFSGVAKGQILGHEGVGIVEAVGSAVSDIGGERHQGGSAGHHPVHRWLRALPVLREGVLRPVR